MTRMKKYSLALPALLILLCIILVACDSPTSDVPADTTLESVTDTPTEVPTETPSEETTEEATAEAPTEAPTEAPLEPETEPEVTVSTRNPRDVIHSVSDEKAIISVSTVTKQASLTDVDLAAVKAAFLEHGYAVVPSSPVPGTKLETVVLKGSAHYVTLMQTVDGPLHVLWENVDSVSVIPLLENGNPSDQPMTMVQIGIARETEDDNPMIGMCYVYRLDDGSAVIIDGGVNNESCAKNIFDTLNKMDIAKDESGKYRINAWIFSHGHGDHYGAFKKFSSLYADKTDVAYFLYSFPVNDLAPGGANAESFATTIRKAYPNAQRIVPHAGLTYRFENLKVHVLYAPELLYTTQTVDYYNNTSLILRLEVGGQSIFHMGDAGEMASEAAWNQNNAEAFKSTALQITHHGLYTGPDSHTWKFMKKVYTAVEAEIGLLPMGTRNPTGTRNGRHTVLVGWGNAGYQVSFVVNRKDNRNGASDEQAYFDQFVADIAAGKADRETLFGYNGINLVTNRDGMITYINASETEPMATVFTLSPEGLSMVSNETLATWLGR